MMLFRKFFTKLLVRDIFCAKTKLGILALFGALLVIFGSIAAAKAQDGNMYEEPWFPAARFAVKEGGKREKAIITLVKVENASFVTGEEGLTFQICMTVNVKKGRKKTVKRYAQTTVFRNDKTMAYMLEKWELLKKPPIDCQAKQ